MESCKPVIGEFLFVILASPHAFWLENGLVFHWHFTKVFSECKVYSICHFSSQLACFSWLHLFHFVRVVWLSVLFSRLVLRNISSALSRSCTWYLYTSALSRSCTWYLYTTLLFCACDQSWPAVLVYFSSSLIPSQIDTYLHTLAVLLRFF